MPLLNRVDMRVLGLACVMASLTVGCATTTQTYVTRTIGQEQVVLESSHGLPSVMGDFSYAKGVVMGHVAWTSDCRRAVVSQQVTDTIETRRPNYKGGAGAVVLGAVVGTLSGALLSEAPTFSDVDDECSTDSNGNYSCSSPRERAYGVGILGALTSVACVVTGLTTFAMRPTSRVIESEAAPPVVSRVIKENVSCGSRPIQDLGLALLRSSERIAVSTTNASGEVAFAVPPNVTGNLVIVVDSVPPPMGAIHVGDVIGSVQVEPAQEPAEETHALLES